MNDKLKELTNLLKQQEVIAAPIDDRKFKSSKKKAQGRKGVPSHIMIPPSRANIMFNLNAKNFKTIAPKFRAPKISLPDYWANYDPAVSKFAKYVSRPENQQKCGSCFAFACASAINDVFIFGRRLAFNPDISPLAILSCVKNDMYNKQCDGGDPLGVLDNIVRNGISTNHCMNYHQVCTSIPSCYQPIKKAFDEAKRDQVFKSANTTIKLPPCGCCPGCDNNFKYYINQPILVSENTAKNIDGRSDAVYNIKAHLFTYGAAVTGYVVYSNFVHDTTNGKFEKTRGIYIESERYCPKNIKNCKEFMGCHAVSIVGWGLEKNPIKLDDGTVLNNTPYWIARNSWSDKWGLRGYFKMAMYQKIGKKEINPTTAFERINNVSIPFPDPVDPKKIKYQTFQVGGTIIFTAKRFEKYNNNRKDCKSKDKCREPDPSNKTIDIPRVKTAIADITRDEELLSFGLDQNNKDNKKILTSNYSNLRKYFLYGAIALVAFILLMFLARSLFFNNKKRKNRRRK